MTDPLYLTDSYQTTATAKVVEVGDTYLILDQTLFYPLGGGQPSDKGVIKSATGTLNVKSVEYNGGDIKHVGTLKGSFAVGQTVSLNIDWPSRQKHMQWHTAGHLVDLVVRQTYPNLVPIRGMHGIGKKLFVEYEGVHEPNLTKLNTELTNLVKSLPAIKTEFVTLEKLKKMSNWLPAKLPTSKKLRILSIGDDYHIPDGGTQLKTGEPIWPISMTQIEQASNSTLVHYSVTLPSTDYFDTSKYRSNNPDIGSSINSLNSQFDADLDVVQTQAELDSLYLRYLGKKGSSTALLSELPQLSAEDKRKYGPLLNALKREQEASIKAKHATFTLNLEPGLDLTVPSHIQPAGRLHPTTQVIRELNSFFRYHGFSVADGPEIENVDYNFRRLNLPEGHPATDLQDTLFVQEPDILMRTHTSSVETRILSEYHDQLPLRVVVPGKCYRNETNNLTNTSFFYQYQGFVVDKGVNIGHLKDMISKWFQFLWGPDVKIRFRYKYYPEVSPGMGQDIECTFCRGKGCQVCKYRGWIEIGGSGMIHSNTLKACNIDPTIYTGFAFGVGLDRMVMTKFGITDIRKLYGGELVYL